MKAILVVFLLQLCVFAQSLIQTIPLPRYAYMDQGYGLVYHDSKLWMSSGSSSPTTNRGKIVSLNLSGAVLDSFSISYPTINTSQGLAFDGTNFWYVERKTARCDLFKVSPAGVVLDSIPIASAGGTTSWYLGGAAWDVDGLWVSLYSPDASAGLYKINTTTKTIVDTIPVFGLQPQGIAVRGDTLFYVMDGFQSDPENIYAVSLATEDTLFSFHVPEQPGVRQNPRGLAWDGQYLWLMAEPVGASVGRSLFKFDLGGSGTPGISILTTSFDFQNVQVDSVKKVTATLRNFGTANLVLDSMRLSNAAFTLQGVTLPVTVKPDSFYSFTIQFKPTAAIAYNDSLLIYHNDPNFVFSKIKFTGSGVYTAPYMQLSQDAFNLGNKRVKSTSSFTLMIDNLGSAKLHIDSMTLKRSTFYFDNPQTAQIIDSLSSGSVRVWFAPAEYRLYTDSLVIYSNASNGAVKTIPLTALGAPFDSTLGNIVWQGMVPDNPGTNFDDYTARMIKGIGDINGDGVEDIIVTTDNYYVVAFNGNSSGNADVLWTFRTNPNNNNTGNVEQYEAFQISNDLDGDGFMDVVVGTAGGNEFVYALNGKTGKKIWEYGDSVNFGNGDIMGVDVRRDFTGDGTPDVLVNASGNETSGEGRFSTYLLNGLTGAEIWRINQSAQRKLKYGVISTDDGGASASRVAGSTPGEVFGFDRAGNVLWSYPTASGPWGIDEIENIGGLSTSDVIVGDINGNVYAISGDAGVELWRVSIGNAFIEDLFVIPDINNSGTDDILLSALTSRLFVLEGSTGAQIINFQTAGNTLGVGLLGDLTADSIPEFGVASLDNNIYVVSGRGSSTALFQYAVGTGNSSVPETIWKMADVDKNGTHEFAVGSRDGRVFAFSGGTDAIVTSLKSNSEIIPDEYRLEQNYPNPFNPSTKINFRIPQEGKVALRLYDVLGREVRTLLNENLKAGYHQYELNAGDMASGVYFYTLSAGELSLSKKLILLK